MALNDVNAKQKLPVFLQMYGCKCRNFFFKSKKRLLHNDWRIKGLRLRNSQWFAFWIPHGTNKNLFIKKPFVEITIQF